MATNNEKMLITSVNKGINRAKVTGMFNLTIVQLFEMYKYYIDFTQDLIDAGYTGVADDNRTLKDLLIELKYKFPSVICNYKNVLTSTPSTTSDTSNTAPTLSDNTVTFEDDTSSYQFTVSDFVVNWADAEGDSWKYLMIIPADSDYGSLGTGSDGSTEVTSTLILNIEGLASSSSIELWFNRNDGAAFGPEEFTFRVSDDASNYLYSSIHTMGVYANEQSDYNSPPDDIGDNTVYVNNRAETVLTLYDFSGGLTPPYSDPEGDDIDAILIVDISDANGGIYYVDGVELYEGQIVTADEISSGLFTHVAPDQDAINSDVFEFKVRDTGSQTWVE